MKPATTKGELTTAQLDVVRRLIKRYYGIWIRDDRMGDLKLKIAQRMNSVEAAEFSPYWKKIQSTGTPSDELRELVEAVLHQESHFNDNPSQLTLLKKFVLLEWRHDAIGRAKRIASLGCATGEEAYSLAMLTEEVLGDKADEVLILGMDVSGRALTAARRARYSESSLCHLTEPVRARDFIRDGEEWVVQPRLIQRVRFLQQDLMKALPPKFVDVIFCCNVLSDFPRETAQIIVDRFHSALKPYGHLFLGPADTVVPNPELFQCIKDGGSTCYIRRSGTDAKPKPNVASQGTRRYRASDLVFK